MPYVSHLWYERLPSPHEFFSNHTSYSAKELSAFSSPTRTAEAASASYIWADCSTVQGYADGAQATVYIYVDGLNVGTAPVEGGNYFSFNISGYVTDGMYHEISAWYYTIDWLWLEAGNTSVSGCYPFYDFDTPRLDPPNDTGDPGVNPASQNINWSVPLVGLPGRGLDLNLSLTYNSLVWIKSSDGGAMMFDPDHGFPSPGFRLRLPIIQGVFYNSNVNVWFYMLVNPSGGRTDLRQVGTSNVYEAADSSYTKLVDHGNGTATVWLKDGTQLSFDAWNGEFRCKQIKDRNGNFISVTYTRSGIHQHHYRHTGPANSFQLRHLLSRDLDLPGASGVGRYAGYVRLRQCVVQSVVSGIQRVCAHDHYDPGADASRFCGRHAVQLRIHDLWSGQQDPPARGRQSAAHLRPLQSRDWSAE